MSKKPIKVDKNLHNCNRVVTLQIVDRLKMASFALTILTAALTMIIFISESAIREHMDDRAELKTTQKCDFDGSLSRERSGSTVSP